MAALAVIQAVLQLPRPRTRPPADYAGTILLGGAATGIVLVTSWGGTTCPWASRQIIAVGWLAAARRAKDPVIPPRLFADRVFAIACAMSLILDMALLGRTRV